MHLPRAKLEAMVEAALAGDVAAAHAYADYCHEQQEWSTELVLGDITLCREGKAPHNGDPIRYIIWFSEFSRNPIAEQWAWRNGGANRA